MSDPKDRGLTPEERRVQDALRGMPEVEPDAALEARLRRAFTSGTIDERDEAPSSGNRGWWAYAAAAAIVVAALFLFMPSGAPEWQVRLLTGSGGVRTASDSAAAGNPAAVQELLADGGELSLDASVSLDLILDQVMVVGVMGGSDVVLPQADPGDDAVFTGHVSAGEMLVKTGPNFAGQRLVITTTDGRVELTGTTIVLNKMPDLTCICVLEGEAMIGVDSADLEPIPPGMRKVMFQDGRPSQVIPTMPEHEQDMLDFESRNTDAFQ